MPLSTGATWPDLKSNFTAAAQDMTAKFEWVEGHRLPMTGGELTASAWDMGSPAASWNRVYADQVTLTPLNLNFSSGSKEGPFSIRAFGKVTVSGGVPSVDYGFNVSTITTDVTGRYQIYLSAPYNTTTAIGNVAFMVSPIHGAPVMTICRGQVGSGVYEFSIYKPTYPYGTATHSSFCFILTGEGQ